MLIATEIRLATKAKGSFHCYVLVRARIHRYYPNSLSSVVKNWPDPPFSWKKRLNLKVTTWLLDHLEDVGDTGIPGVDGLSRLARRRKDGSVFEAFYDKLARPPSIELVPLQVALCDLYSISEFEQVASGLDALLGKHAPRLHRPFGRLADWIADIEDEPWAVKPGHYVDLSSATSGRSQYADRMNIVLIKISPSFLSLIAFVVPSDAFKAEFQKLISKKTKPGVFISSFHPWRKHHSHAKIPPRKVRHIELDKLFLELNKEVVSVLRSYVGGGLAQRGPLPAIEVYTTNQSTGTSDDLPFRRDNASSLEDNTVNFWEGIGYPMRLANSYVEGFYRLVGARRSKELDLHNYILLVNVDEFNEQKDSDAFSLEGYNTYQIPHLGALISLKELLLQLRRDVVSLQRELAPSANNKETPSFIRLRRVAGQLSRCHILKYLQAQALAEANLSEEQNIFSANIPDFERRKHREDGWELLYQDLKWQIEQIRKYNDLQLDNLTHSYDNLLSIKHVAATYALQMAIVVLSIALLIVALELF